MTETVVLAASTPGRAIAYAVGTVIHAVDLHSSRGVRLRRGAAGDFVIQ
jgi:hypothetical protein